MGRSRWRSLRRKSLCGVGIKSPVFTKGSEGEKYQHRIHEESNIVVAF